MLGAKIETFGEHCNLQRYHENLDKVTPTNAYFVWASAIAQQRARIKRQANEHQRLQPPKLAA